MADLLVAYTAASRHKRSSKPRLEFELRFEEELTDLARSIMDGCYEIRPCTRFMVTSPVLREVIAADFRDRIVHHYIHAYLNPTLERLLIHDCYSCRTGKGTHFGVERLKHHILSCSQQYTRPAYVLQLDIRGYFMHIDRNILYRKAMTLMDKIGSQRHPAGKLLRELPKHRLVTELLHKVIYHDPIRNCVYRGNPALSKGLPPSKSLLYSPDMCGLPIGNLTSQLFSNLYLNDFDRWVKSDFHIRHYGRYVDDFYLIHTDAEYLKSLIAPMARRLSEVWGLELHPNKIKLQEVKKGVTFLGIHLKPYRRYLSHATRKRICKRVAKLNEEVAAQPGEIRKQRKYREYMLAHANSYLGILTGTASYGVRKRMFRDSALFEIAYATPFLHKFVLHAHGILPDKRETHAGGNTLRLSSGETKVSPLLYDKEHQKKTSNR